MRFIQIIIIFAHYVNIIQMYVVREREDCCGVEDNTRESLDRKGIL